PRDTVVKTAGGKTPAVRVGIGSVTFSGPRRSKVEPAVAAIRPTRVKGSRVCEASITTVRTPRDDKPSDRKNVSVRQNCHRVRGRSIKESPSSDPIKAK